MRISPEKFVKTWQESETSHEVATKLEMTVDNVRSRSWWYRKRGINLKKLPHGKSLDIDALNALCNGQAEKKKK